jgi:hypothetical protein
MIYYAVATPLLLVQTAQEEPPITPVLHNPEANMMT